MFRVNQLTDYACLVLVCLSSRQADERLSSTQVAELVGLEQPTVAKVLKMLTKADLVSSARGQRGGYRLLVPAAEINLKQLIEAMEGPIGITRCVTGDVTCCHTGSCDVQNHWHSITDEILRVLARVSIADMAKHSPLPLSTHPVAQKNIPLVSV